MNLSRHKETFTYFKGYSKIVGFTAIIKLIFRKIFSNFFLKRKFAKCNSLLLMKDYQISGGKYIKIEKLSAGRSFRIEAISQFYATTYSPEISIGSNVSFGHNIHIGCIEKVSIGNDLLGGSNILILDHDHGDYGLDESNASDPNVVPSKRQLISSPIIIGNNVFIGEYVCILKGVTIGDGSVIAANSVVTKSIPSNTLVAGNPANAIKKYNSNKKTWEKILK